MKNKLQIKGFTLIELLVVIAIIGILTSIVTANMSGAKVKARDAKRISDIGQIQLALELYFDRCREYPAAVSNKPDLNDGCGTGTNAVKFSDFISVIPTPPGNDKYDYFTGTNDYLLRATLEKDSEVLKDSKEGSFYGATCSRTSLNYCLGPK